MKYCARCGRYIRPGTMKVEAEGRRLNYHARCYQAHAREESDRLAVRPVTARFRLYRGGVAG